MTAAARDRARPAPSPLNSGGPGLVGCASRLVYFFLRMGVLCFSPQKTSTSTSRAARRRALRSPSLSAIHTYGDLPPIVLVRTDLRQEDRGGGGRRRKGGAGLAALLARIPLLPMLAAAAAADAPCPCSRSRHRHAPCPGCASARSCRCRCRRQPRRQSTTRRSAQV